MRAEESKGRMGAPSDLCPAHRASSGSGGHSLAFTLEIGRGGSSQEWEFPAKHAGKVQYHMAKKNHTLKLFLRIVRSVS